MIPSVDFQRDPLSGPRYGVSSGYAVSAGNVDKRWATRRELSLRTAESASATEPKSEMATFVPWKADRQTQARFPD